MSEELVFYMGRFEAKFPTDRLYARNHMWAQIEGDRVRFGFSAYAVRLLQDVFFLEWSVNAGDTIRNKQAIGEIESSKAESELYSPLSGVLEQFNLELLADPSFINVDPYQRGWLFTIQGPPEGLLSPTEYLKHLESSWTVAEKTIKGQINEME